MILRVRSFTYVVKQQSKIQQVRLLEFVQELRKTSIPFRLGLPKCVQIFDGHEAVFVHGEPVRIVSDNQRIYDREFRKQRGEQTQRMHGPQRLGRMGREKNLLQIVPEFRSLRRGSRYGRNEFLYLMFGS